MQALHLEELPYSLDSCSLFARLRDLEMPVFLDSASPYSQRGRYDIISANPSHIIKISPEETGSYTQENLFQAVKSRLQEYPEQLANDYQLPFIGGAIGFFGYDLGQQLEKLPRQLAPDINSPDALVGIYHWAIIVDHHNRRTLLVAHPQLASGLIADVRRRLNKITTPDPLPFELLDDFRSNFSREDYQRAFSTTQHYIQAGDCYQVNLAQRFSSRYQGDSWQAYQGLREVAAAPYSAYLEHEQWALMSLSPERFLKVDGRKVITSPIKGTIGRGIDAVRDQLLAQQLILSEKDRAENLMIVDLLRNDLGRSCHPGSIQVEQLFELQSFETVHHLVSTISGELRQGIHALDLLASCFPGGSITGAPKIRAMEIIEELEAHRRSAYCGAIGYISFDGQMDTNIAIRTLLCEDNNIHCWAGGGIVADSRCEAEYEEAMSKVKKFLQVLQASRKTPVKSL